MMDSTVRYLGVELEDALAIAEAIDINGPSSQTAHGVERRVWGMGAVQPMATKAGSGKACDPMISFDVHM
jgi:hypothetical protein